MKRLLIVVALVMIPCFALAQFVPTGGQGPSVDATGLAGVASGSFAVKDADGAVVGDSVWGISALADFDSSLAFNAITWETVLVETYWIGGGNAGWAAADTTSAAGRDSNNVRIYHMGSIDGVYWTRVDSTSVTDTTVTFDTVTWPGWPWYKTVVRGLAKCGIRGAAGRVRLGFKGAK